MKIKTKNAFTLIELLATVIILGFISLMVVPAVDRALNRSRNELYTIQISNIREGAKNWAAKNFVVLPDKNGDIITLTLGQLKLGGFVDKDIKNPKSRKYFPNDMEIIIRNISNNYEYIVVEDSGGLDNEINYDMPSITLKGLVHEIVEFEDNYVDEGVVAQEPGGSIIEDIFTVITSNGIVKDKVDTDTLVQYKITYSVEYRGKTTSVIRTVTVKDTIPPVIEVEDKTISVEEVADFNLKSDVSIIDNYDKTIAVDNLEIRGVINEKVGVYHIEYRVSDSSGNVGSTIRKITVIGTET